MPQAKYLFNRADGMEGFFNTNRPSTDALNVLQSWISKSSRSYKVVKDEDDQLIAILSFDDDDESAGTDLDSSCQSEGVKRSFIE